MSIGSRRPDERPDHPGRPERHQQDARDQQPRPHADPHVPRVRPAGRQPHQQRPDQKHRRGADFLAHNSHQPTSAADSSATPNVSGANRHANRGLNVPACNAISFTSTIGPTTRKASRAVRENSLSPSATNASASEQSASSTASSPRASTDSGPAPASESTTRRGTSVCNVAAAPAPITRNPPACRKSCWALARKRRAAGPPPGAPPPRRGPKDG